MNKRVVVGMSGGVDSSVAAYLLKEQGYDVVGVTMQVWDASCSLTMEREGGCCGQSAVEDASRVCRMLDIPYYVINFRDIFQKKVIDYFVDEYIAGRTPNPCIACNRYVKWEAMLRKAMEIGADYIATGHYARIEKLENGRLSIRNSVTARKDQTYALYALTQFQLSHTLMPVGEYHKEQIRAIAAEANLPVAAKPDSQEVCFIPDDDYAGYLDREAPDRVPPPGRFVTADGKDLGPNKGITHYTIGQRKHLGLSMGHPVYVTDIRPQDNAVVIGDNADVMGRGLVCSGLNFMSQPDIPSDRFTEAVGKIRYNHAGTRCRIRRIGDDTVECRFLEDVRAITPGQAAVFYEGDHILCGGRIDRKIS